MAHEVYSFKRWTKSIDMIHKDCELPTSTEPNLIAGLIDYSIELHEKDLQMLMDKFKEQKCFASKINKTVVESGNLESCDVVSQLETTQSTSLVVDDTKDLINF